MFKRATWLAVGFSLGVGTTVAAGAPGAEARQPLPAERDGQPGDRLALVDTRAGRRRRRRGARSRRRAARVGARALVAPGS